MYKQSSDQVPTKLIHEKIMSTDFSFYASYPVYHTGCPKINFTFLKFCSFKSKPPIATPKSQFVRGDL